MPCYSPLKGFVNKESGGIVFKRSKLAGAEMEVACGQCLGCRLDYSRTWGFRQVHESLCHDDNSFITLTYAPENLPRGGTLVKEHLQKFFKRLRHHIAPRRVRYYACGEYGSKLTRPHYHANLFGLDFEDKELFSQQPDYNIYTSEMLSDIWQLGFVTCGEFTLQTAMYTARYITKKVTGPTAHEHYQNVDLQTGELYQLLPEFTVMSRRPGLGRDYYERYNSDFFPSDEIPVPGSGVFKKVPRYYETIFQSDDPVGHEEIKRIREKFRAAHGHEYTPDRLMSKYKVKMAQVSKLPRGYENET